MHTQIYEQAAKVRQLNSANCKPLEHDPKSRWLKEFND